LRDGLTPDIEKAIVRVIGMQHQLRPEKVYFVKPRALPRTSSGKIQRRRIVQMIQSGEFE